MGVRFVGLDEAAQARIDAFLTRVTAHGARSDE
jgi:hypothetical protein